MQCLAPAFRQRAEQANSGTTPAPAQAPSAVDAEKEIATLRQIKQRELELAKHSRMSLDQLYQKIQKGEVKDLNVIVKGDVQGSVEAVGEAGIRPNDLAKRLGVSRRTAYRDLKALEMEVDVPIWNEHGRWGVSQSGLLPALRFSRDEALAIVLAARLLAKFATGYDPELGAALMKLGGMLDEPLRSAVERTVSQLSDLRDQPEAQSRLRILANAWVNGRVVEFEYAAAWSNPGTTRTARVHPYLIEPSSATLATYLIGYDETRSAMRTFRADRIVNPRITPSTFVRPKDVELERTLAAAWDIVADQPLEEIVVRFTPEGLIRRIEVTDT